MIILLPCPFCGEEAQLTDGGFSGKCFLVRCASGKIRDTCPASSGTVCETKEEAITIWNNRISTEKFTHLSERICKNCGYFRKSTDPENRGWESWCILSPCENQTFWYDTCSDFNTQEDKERWNKW